MTTVPPPRLQPSTARARRSALPAERAVAALRAATSAISAAKLAAVAAGDDVDGQFVEERRVHDSLVTIVLRLAVLAFAEPRKLLGARTAFVADPSCGGELSCVDALREVLRGGARPRGGAWRRVGALFRTVHDAHGGCLFDVRRYPCFDDTALADHVDDAAVLRLLDAVAGLSADWTAVEVEHLGGVYEALIGLRVAVARESAVVVRARRLPGVGPADVCVGLTTLLEMEGARRGDDLDGAGVRLGAAGRLRVARAATEFELAAALGRRVSSLCPTIVPAGGLLLVPTVDRRRSGAHYTSQAVTSPIVAATLAPLLAVRGAVDGAGSSLSAEAILALSVCDPAMGSGAFVVEACRQLGAALARARARDGTNRGSSRAYADIAKTCLFGVDKDPIAVDLARISLWLVVAGAGGLEPQDRAQAGAVERAEEPMSFVDHALRVGDALVGAAPVRLGASQDESVHAEATEGRDQAQRRLADAAVESFFERSTGQQRRSARSAARRVARPATPDVARVQPFHWALELPAIFAGSEPGFDAIVGNPPWVSYVGRAAQPLEDGMRSWFAEHYRSFAGYRNLQGLFVERAATLLKPGGRLGLVVPSSMSELEGYAPTRRAHDALCECDATLLDLGEETFGGVFQPCLVLQSTRRACRRVGSDAPWPVERPDLDAADLSIVRRLTAGPPLPPNLFGERGLQTQGADIHHVRREPDSRHTVALHVGADVAPFRLLPPTLFADATWFDRRLRGADAWRRVRFYVRQTARVPLACLADGEAFRNSVLAGFASDPYSAPFLVAWLSSTPIRWLHWVRHRDARQGMPQMKIRHLRRTPAPPNLGCLPPLARLGHELSERNAGVSESAQAQIDAIVADAFALTRSDVSRIEAWRRR